MPLVPFTTYRVANPRVERSMASVGAEGRNPCSLKFVFESTSELTNIWMSEYGEELGVGLSLGVRDIRIDSVTVGCGDTDTDAVGLGVFVAAAVGAMQVSENEMGSLARPVWSTA
jgi:hypothetical protein